VITIPWVGGSVLSIALAMIFGTVGLVLKGRLIPRKQHEDVRKDAATTIEAVRADAAKAIKDAREDRDARVTEANEDAEQWRRFWEEEHRAHELTRRAHDEERRAELRAAAEGTQLAASLLQTIHARQIEAGHDT
jgi:hypothetical protein